MSERDRNRRQEHDRIEERFVRYVRVDTASDHDSPSIPSTANQLDLQRILAGELRDLGAEDVRLTDYGCVLATIPATVESDDAPPTVALMAHVDTSPDFSGQGVEPLIIRDYDGSPIVLPAAPERILDEESAPELAEKKGETIISASGTTLLGADDKAGVAIIMTLAERLLADRSIPHGRLRICFTPDEEVGRGVENLSLEDLDADVAYTLDGEAPGEITYESFSADEAVVTIEGVS
ncbi:tripeptide aminopeptidase PepT, partial [Candidatus Bipolaricaulota bacterium]|nr:tripeptide aminopeptidase PepT [Candidatus Bipolaricaulota bacterium]